MPKGNYIPASVFNIIFYDIGIINAFNLFLLFIMPTYFKSILVYFKICFFRSLHLVINFHLREKECFPNIADIRFVIGQSISEVGIVKIGLFNFSISFLIRIQI